MSSTTKTIPAVSGEPTPADPRRQLRILSGRIRKLIFDLVSRTYGKWNPRMRHKLARVKEAVYPCDWENHERPP